jgi:hypothetical protein
MLEVGNSLRPDMPIRMMDNGVIRRAAAQIVGRAAAGIGAWLTYSGQLVEHHCREYIR